MASNNVGRPLKFQSVEELQKQIDEFFKWCTDNNKPMTITGLALALDTSRETLLEYEDRPEYVDTIKRAKLQCQNFTEQFLYEGKNATGAIFSLKNNYGWRDRTETDITTQGESVNQLHIPADKIADFASLLAQDMKKQV